MKATSTVIVNPYHKNKLSALIKIDYYQPVRFNYTVHGKSNNVDFYYANDRYAVNPEVTVVGLYANYANTVTLTLYTEQGEVQTSIFTISTEGQDYGDVALTLAINIDDRDMADNTLGQGWFVTSEWNGYDINGDLRITGLFPWMYGNLKIIDNSLWSALASETYDPDKHAFAPTL